MRLIKQIHSELTPDEVPAEGFKVLGVKLLVAERWFRQQRFTVLHGVLSTRAPEEVCNETSLFVRVHDLSIINFRSN